MANLAAEWNSATPVSLADEWEKATPVEAGVQKATVLDRARAGLGGINTGIAGLAGLPVDTAENIVNLGIAGFGTAATALGKPEWAPNLITGTPGGSQNIIGLMERAGIGTTNPRPDDLASRMLHTGGRIVGGSVFPGATVKNTIGPATIGPVAGETLGPEWTGVGAMAPTAANRAITSARNAVASRAAPILQTFKQAGAQPSVGQVTDNTFFHGLENLATKFPGGAGVMEKFITAQQTAMGAQARTGVPAEAAGRAIEKGITGDTTGFLARTKATWQKLDSDVANKIPKTATFAPVNTVAALDDLTKPVLGAAQSTGTPLDARIVSIKENMLADLKANNGQMPFEALRIIRSRVGAQIDDALVQGAKSGEMSKLYAALSKDLKAAAEQAGAGREFARQNNYYRTRMARIETVLDRVIGKGRQPEDIFKTVMPTDPDQANKLRATLRSLSKDERQVVSEAVANRLGRAKPGAQDIEGTVFSSETFLSNWNRLSPGAKAQLFPDPPLRENMEKIARASATIREGKGIYANPSGTAGSFAAYSIYLAPLTALGYGISGTAGAAGVLATAGIQAGGAYVGSKMLTNPKIVEWLATPIKPNSAQASAHLARLAVIYNNLKDEKLKEELAAFVSSAGNQDSGKPQNTLRNINPQPIAPSQRPSPMNPNPGFVRG